MSTPVEWRPTSDQKEQVIWCLNFTKGIFHKKIVDSWIITNYRVLVNNSEIWLKDIDDIIVTNQRRVSNRLYSGRYGVGVSNSTSISIGDVLFLYQGKPYVIFRQVSDPQGIARLAKAARKRILDAIIVQYKIEQSRSLTQDKEDKAKIGHKNIPSPIACREQKKGLQNYKLSNIDQQKMENQFLKDNALKSQDDGEENNDCYHHTAVASTPSPSQHLLLLK
ncbi:MAG: hypothetical protein M3044_10120 [Thermoproteota archaeon]|nr:hypothetical protein [Thermoproteota archaeon]